MNKILTLAIAGSCLALTACQTQQTQTQAAPAAAAATQTDPNQASYEAALADAKAAIAAAKAAGNEWRDSGKLIKSAEAAAAKGEFYKAKRIAMTAEAQGHDAVSQANENKNAGNPGYLY